jgi:protein involved in sex pheromone biosynthesis
MKKILIALLSISLFLSSCAATKKDNHYPQKGHDYPHSQNWEHVPPNNK